EDQVPRREGSARVRRIAALVLVAATARSLPAAADSAERVASAEHHFEELDYELVLGDSDAVIADASAPVAHKARALFVRGEALVVLDRDADANAAFTALLSLDPEFRPPPTSPPRIRAAFESALAAWRVGREEELATKFGAQLREVKLDVDAPVDARGGRPLQLRVRLRDPQHLANRLVLGYRRESEREYSRISAAAAPSLVLAIPGAVLGSDKPYRLAWYVHATHESGAVVRRSGDEAEPRWLAVAAGQPPRPPPITRRWWFWTGIATLTISAVAIPLLIDRARDVGPQHVVVMP
ncbi:MAG TPA: hypothetical protein VLB44_17610, partial [Kofleriaceae bacterium]|nr:hypothetical protein [Kofleriaceae bacterium]